MAQRVVRLCQGCKRRPVRRMVTYCTVCEQGFRDKEWMEICRGLAARLEEHLSVCACGGDRCEVCLADRKAIREVPGFDTIIGPGLDNA
jgi:hypothetical protein